MIFKSKKEERPVMDAGLFERIYEQWYDPSPEVKEQTYRDIIEAVYAYLLGNGGDYRDASRRLFVIEQRVKEREAAEAARIAAEYGDE